MKMRIEDSFSKLHPSINFLYFLFVIGFSMVLLHPLCLGVSLCGGFAYSILLKGRRATFTNYAYLLPMLLVMALVNPAFNHEGMTILTYLENGNPLTLESILYGIAAAAMIVSVIAWFSCYNVIMTSDKFIYLFGKILPALSLILSMSLRFIPRFREQLQAISIAQRGVGQDVSNGSLMQRIKNGITILSILVTWALENAIETADSMKSRGYGLPGRTAFSIFRFDARDKKALAFLLGSGAYIIVGILLGGFRFRYFPSVKGSFTIYTWSVIFVQAVLYLMPVIMEARYRMKWNTRNQPEGRPYEYISAE